MRKISWMAEPSAGADANGAKSDASGAPHCRECLKKVNSTALRAYSGTGFCFNFVTMSLCNFVTFLIDFS